MRNRIRRFLYLAGILYFWKRMALLRAIRRASAKDLLPECSGNLSVATRDGRIMTPSGIAYEKLTVWSFPLVLSSTKTSEEEPDYIGWLRPTSEWRFHLDIARAFPEDAVILHSHSFHAESVSCLHMDIPSWHYMAYMASGTTEGILCTPKFREPGNPLLSDDIIAAFRKNGGKAVLMAGHGQVVRAATYHEAIRRAVQVERESRRALALLPLYAFRPPFLLSREEKTALRDVFARYGQQK